MYSSIAMYSMSGLSRADFDYYSAHGDVKANTIARSVFVRSTRACNLMARGYSPEGSGSHFGLLSLHSSASCRQNNQR